MQLMQWVASASVSMAVLAAAVFPPHQMNEQQATANALELERVLVTCGNKGGDLRHPETRFCLQWWAARQGHAGPASMCSDCVAACAEGDYATCRNACTTACGFTGPQEKMNLAEKIR